MTRPMSPAGDPVPSVELRALGWLLRTVAALGPSLLPSRLRRALGMTDGPALTAACVVTGIAEAVLALVLGGLAFARFREAFTAAVLQSMGRLITEAESHPINDGVLMGMGVIVYFKFFFTLPGIAALYFFVEGLARALSGALAGAPAGTLPAFLVVEGVAWVRARRRRAREAEALIDDVLLVPARGEDGADDGAVLVIASCRPRDWDDCTTVAVDENLYRVARYERSRRDEARPHRYHLAAWPAQTAVRRLVGWSPDELRRAAGAGDATARR